MLQKNENNIRQLCKLIRYDILSMTSAAASGHATSALSAVELMATLFFGGYYHYDLKHTDNIFNDRIIFSKGHASPLLYALYHAAGALSQDELLTLRHLTSHLEGHPTLRFPYTEVATGSLGQGLSMAVGMALGMRLKFQCPITNNQRTNNDHLINGNSLSIDHCKLNIPKIYVLLGDSELAEGQNWEAAQIASYYKLDNIVAIVDVNRLGQRGETMLEWDLKSYEKRFQAFGWNTIILPDGHDISQISKAYNQISQCSITNNQRLTTNDQRPTVIIAKTIKGKGVAMWENKNGFHSKQIAPADLKKVIKELGDVDLRVRGTIQKPLFVIASKAKQSQLSKIATGSLSPRNDRLNSVLHRLEKTLHATRYALHDLVPTKLAFGQALVDLGAAHPEVVVLDAEVSNSTHTDMFKKAYPDRFFEMFIAEQNMVSTAVGLDRQGFVPFVSTFAAFVSRAFDQIRMAQYSKSHMIIAGSYAGVMTGMDGASGMGLEDIAMMRSIQKSTVVYPSDAVSAYKLTKELVHHKEISYIRLTREKTPVLYEKGEEFPIGGLKILRSSPKDKVVLIGAGITVHVALKAYELLKKQSIFATVVDLYSIKPLDVKTLQTLAKKVPHFIVAEDHYEFGGIGEAVSSALYSNDQFSITNNQRINNGHLKNRNSLNIERLNIDHFCYDHLCIRKLPHSGTPQELLHFEHLDERSMVNLVLKTR